MEQVPQIGEAFIPHKKFLGVMIPDAVLRSSLSFGAKAAYGVLTRFAGENGDCYPSLKTIGERIGCSETHTKRLVAELVRVGLISRTKGSTGKANQYKFLWHSWFTEGADPTPVTAQICAPCERRSDTPRESVKRIIEERATDSDAVAAPSEPAPVSAGCVSSTESLRRTIEGAVTWKVSPSMVSRIVFVTPNVSPVEAEIAIRDALARRGPWSKPIKSANYFERCTNDFYNRAVRLSSPPTACPNHGAFTMEQAAIMASPFDSVAA